jgi:hypothetical protein
MTVDVCSWEDYGKFKANIRAAIKSPEVKQLLTEFASKSGVESCSSTSAGNMKAVRTGGGNGFSNQRIKQGMFIAGVMLAAGVQIHTVTHASQSTCGTAAAIAHMVVHSGYCQAQRQTFEAACQAVAASWGGVALASGFAWFLKPDKPPLPPYFSDDEKEEEKEEKEEEVAGGKGLRGSRTKRRRGSHTKRRRGFRTKHRRGSRTGRKSKSRIYRTRR